MPQSEFKVIDSDSLVEGSIRKLKQYWDGQITPIPTTFPHFNNLCEGGFLQGNIYIIAGMSGSGKSTILQSFETSFFEDPSNLLIRCNWEMSVEKLFMRRLKDALGISGAILRGVGFTPTEEQRKIMSSIRINESAPNIKYNPTPTSAMKWLEGMEGYLKVNHAKWKNIMITIDHAALVSSGSMGVKNSIDDIVSGCNAFRKRYQNVIIVILSQLNRGIEGRSADPRNHAPRREDLYCTDTMFQIADVVLVVHNPYSIGVSEYMSVKASDYARFRDYLLDKKGKYTNFASKNLLFWHYIKLREIDDLVDTDRLDVTIFNDNYPAGREAETVDNTQYDYDEL